MYICATLMEMHRMTQGEHIPVSISICVYIYMNL